MLAAHRRCQVRTEDVALVFLESDRHVISIVWLIRCSLFLSVSILLLLPSEPQQLTTSTQGHLHLT